jgi:flagellar biosynthesis protein
MTDKTSKKPRQKSAVAIKYNQNSQEGAIDDGESSGGAPTIIAKGFGDLAQDIITLATQNGVLVHEDPYLSDFLATLDLGQEIPDQLYHVIAELISFSYVLQGKFPDSWAKMHNKVSKKV